MKTLKSTLIFIIFLIIGFGCSIKDKGLTNEGAKIINDKYEKLWEKGDAEIAYDILDSNYTLISPFFPERLKGIETLVGFINNTSVSFADFKLITHLTQKNKYS